MAGDRVAGPHTRPASRRPMTTTPHSTPQRATPRSAAPLALLAALAAIPLLDGCGHPREYLWVDDVPASAVSASDGTYRIAPGDVIGVRVWNQESMSIERARVREDGKISLPLLKDVEVAGMEPAELGQRLEV